MSANDLIDEIRPRTTFYGAGPTMQEHDFQEDFKIQAFVINFGWKKKKKNKNLKDERSNFEESSGNASTT